MITALAAALTTTAMPRFHSASLKEVCVKAGLQLPDSMPANADNDSTWRYNGRTLRVRTNALCDVSHIGMKIFDSRLATTYKARPLLDYIERYALEEQFPANDEERRKREAKEMITFVKGNRNVLAQLTPNIPFTVEEIERRGYRITWTTANGNVTVSIPADYQLITGTTAVELEDIFERDVQRQEPVYATKQLPCQWNNATVSCADGVSILSDGVYLSETIRSDVYMEEHDGKMRVVNDVAQPLQSVRNILLTGINDHPLPLRLTLNRYGYKRSDTYITLQQFLAYCQMEGCRMFVGIKSQTTEEITATVFALNAAMGYNHMLSVKFPLSLLENGNGVIEGQLFAYIPIQNVTEKFFTESINTYIR